MPRSHPSRLEAARRSSPARGPGRPAQADADLAADVRERLLDAAAALAAERGLDAAGIRAIADRAGVSSGMIAYYFGDRRGLHEAMFERAFARLSAEFARALAAHSGDDDLLDHLLHLHTTALSADPWMARFIAREVLSAEGPARERFSELLAAGPLESFRVAIAEAIERGQLRADLDPMMVILTIASASAFPYLVGPMLSETLGYRLDSDFRDRLIAHNQALIAEGLRAPAPPRPEEEPG